MIKEMGSQHPLFIKYTREWLHQVTGYSKGFFSRVATGRAPLTRSFIERVCFKLGLPEAELFLPNDCDPSVGQWLEERCRVEHLSNRQAGVKTGLSHATIADIRNGSQPSPKTIMKLAQGFGGDGNLALEDYLSILAGYRSKQPEDQEPTYLKVIPLLSAEHQHVVKVLVTELAKVERTKAAVFRKRG